MTSHTMKPVVGPVCCGWMHSGGRRSPGLHHRRVRRSLAYRQILLSSLKTTERHSTLQSTLARHQSSRARRCRDVSGSLVRYTRDLSPAANRRFQIVLGGTSGVTCDRISSLDAVRTSTAVHTMRRSWHVSVLLCRPEPGLRVWHGCTLEWMLHTLFTSQST